MHPALPGTKAGFEVWVRKPGGMWEELGDPLRVRLGAHSRTSMILTYTNKKVENYQSRVELQHYGTDNLQGAYSKYAYFRVVP